MRSKYEDGLGAYEDDEREEAPVRRRQTVAPAKKLPEKVSDGTQRFTSVSRKKGAEVETSAVPRKRPVQRGEGEVRRASPKPASDRPNSARPASAKPPVKRTAARDDYRDYEQRPRPRPSKRKKRRASPMLTLTYWIIAVALAFGISYFLHQNVFEIVRVSGDAMYETMMDGDLVLVSKLGYKDKGPDRGDIVSMGITGRKGVVLRRVVGMPGETVEVVSGETKVNGVPLLEQYIGLVTYDSFAGKTLPADKYYVLGDNRTELTDSRSDEVGLVDRADVIGQACWVIWPLNHMGSL